MSTSGFTCSLCGLALAAFAIGPATPSEGATPDPRDRVVFTQANFEFTEEEIATVRADGSQYTVLTDHEGFDVSAEYSPDGRRIAFTSARSMPPGFPDYPLPYSELYVMNADGSNVRRITSNVGLIDFEPAWSPDGRRIVVARGSSAPPPPDQLTQPTDLWIIDLASGRERQLTDSPATWEGWPHWSPDGRRIAFEGDPAEPGNNDVYTIQVDGTDLRRITSRPGYDGDAHYSPDGRSIGFDSDRTGNIDVFVMRDTGASIRQLTTDPGDDYAGAYTADGKFIAFASDRDSDSGIPDIFRMRADGEQEVNLTRTPTLQEFDPDWQS
jgi:Tol biopolymer transport system component